MPQDPNIFVEEGLLKVSMNSSPSRKKKYSLGKIIVPTATVQLDNENPNNQKLLGYGNNRK